MFLKTNFLIRLSQSDPWNDVILGIVIRLRIKIVHQLQKNVRLDVTIRSIDNHRKFVYQVTQRNQLP